MDVHISSYLDTYMFLDVSAGRVLLYEYYNQNLNNLQNDAETPKRYVLSRVHSHIAPTLTPITFTSTSANKIFASSADSFGS